MNDIVSIRKTRPLAPAGGRETGVGWEAESFVSPSDDFDADVFLGAKKLSLAAVHGRVPGRKFPLGRCRRMGTRVSRLPFGRAPPFAGDDSERGSDPQAVTKQQLGVAELQAEVGLHLLHRRAAR
jgi:hypothetical protein